MNRIFSGLCLCVLVTSVIILPACGGGGGHPPPPPSPISVAITSPASAPTIQQGQTVNITATLTNDTGNKGVTWSLSGQGSLSAQTSTTVTYNAPGSVTSNIVATVTATSVADNTKSASLNITVTPAAANNNGVLSGQYAFLISGFDDATGDRFAYIGSFTANGSGAITTGVEDINLPSGAQNSVGIQGAYSVGTDNRGSVALAGGGLITTFAFSLGAFNAGVATKLDIIEFDDNSGATGLRGSGVAYLQTAAAFNLTSITGAYAFQLNGQTASVGSKAVVEGSFSTAGTGTINAGVGDSNLAGTVTLGSTVSGTLATTASTASNGRLTLPFTVGTISDNSVVYVVSGGHLLLMTTDPISSGLLSGEIQAQTSTAFSNSSLTGNVVLYSSGLSTVAGNSFVQAGILNFNSANANGTVSLDTNDGGTQGTVSTTFTYSVAANGQVTLTPATGPVLDLYLIDTNKAFIMDEGSLVNSGMLQAQSAGPFSNSSVSGSYFLGLAEYPAVTAADVSSSVAYSSGNGVLFSTSDQSSASGSLLTAQMQTFTLTISGATGRATDASGNIYYIISPTSFVTIEATAHDSNVILAEQ
ncbi:MAG TPA: hypothetical protein VKS20_12425 [Candidatus Acidoferrales bacterium]|nr:hypothetical protein [Candidatus Acidoferrales bacterium]